MNIKNIEIAYIIIPDVGVKPGESEIKEIEALTASAGAQIYKTIICNVRIVNPSSFIGSGKLEEVRRDIIDSPVNLIIFDGELSPTQTLNISNILNDIKVVDRTTLILDIFARNAFTAEGKLQVELAQLKYIYPRLKGNGAALSRLGGGIGTRGPGESQLETDRRHIRGRIIALEKKLSELENRRLIQKQRRNKNGCKTVALVGYTNAGKSTLMNALTDADCYVEDKLFATLDPAIKKLMLENIEVLVIDTVGFVRNIPHHIIEAFKSTLELAVEADLILNICDGSSDYQAELNTTCSTLSEFSALPEIITVINKCDKISDFSGYPKAAVFISAKTGFGVENLKLIINEKLSSEYQVLELFVDYRKLKDLNKLLKYSEKHQITYAETGADVKLSVRNSNLTKFKEFI